MTLMKDMVTPDGRLKGNRINCHDVYHYLKRQRPHTEIALTFQIFPEEVLALIHYIVEHETEVEENWQAFEAKVANGNPPEIEEKLVETRARMKAWLEDRHRQQSEEKTRERVAG